MAKPRKIDFYLDPYENTYIVRALNGKWCHPATREEARLWENLLATQKKLRQLTSALIEHKAAAPAGGTLERLIELAEEITNES